MILCSLDPLADVTSSQVGKLVGTPGPVTHLLYDCKSHITHALHRGSSGAFPWGMDSDTTVAIHIYNYINVLKINRVYILLLLPCSAYLALGNIINMAS